MELQFNQTEVSYLNPVVQECRNLEQTQEVRLSDGMPDLDRILGCWGQFVLRGKEWRTDTVSITGGVMLWVMYRPEDGGAPVVLDGWVPFGAKWELPRDTREGKCWCSRSSGFWMPGPFPPERFWSAAAWG